MVKKTAVVINFTRVGNHVSADRLFDFDSIDEEDAKRIFDILSRFATIMNRELNNGGSTKLISLLKLKEINILKE